MPSILQNHYVLAVHNLDTNAVFLEKLGFRVVNKPDGWIFLQKDNCMIMLGECKNATLASELGDHSYFAYLRVDDVDAYYRDIKKKHVSTFDEPSTKPWQMREFGLRLPEGHRLTIGQWMDVAE
jgi:catechol 2,3-dioxygenase-like lactoylglutathione lyase family enzyme